MQVNFPKWLPRIGMVIVLGSTLAGCCVVPVAPRVRYYEPAVVVRPAPVFFAAGWSGGWHR